MEFREWPMIQRSGTLRERAMEVECHSVLEAAEGRVCTSSWGSSGELRGGGGT